MILLFPSKGNLTEGQTVPLIQVPLSMIEGGETVELNDFQWWAKTSDWQAWLKKNPRKVTSESLDPEYFDDLNDFPHHSSIKRLKTFEDFSFEEIYEDEDTEGDPEKTDAFIKFLRAKDSLNKSGAIDKSISLETITPGEELSWFLSYADDQGGDASETEMAYKIKKKFTSGGQFSIYELTEIQPLNKKIDEQTTLGQIFEQTSQFFSKSIVLGGLALSGFIVLKTVGGIYNLFSLRSRLRRIPGRSKKIASLNKAKSFLTKGGKWAFRGLKDTANLLKGVVQGFGKGFKWARQGYKFSRQAGKARTLAFKNSLQAFGRGLLKGSAKFLPKTASRAIPVVGWILAIGDVAQQSYNWFSGNQAPRYGELEDSKFAHDSFEPGKIPAGEIITVCWTQEGKASSSWVGFLPFTADDTRTTMDLAKVGDFGSSSLFILLNIGSKGLSEAFMQNDITFIVYDKSAKFEHGILDNDDLVFKVVPIKDASKGAEAMYFHGICPWNDFMEAYNSSSPDLVVVDSSAPEDFKFNFQLGSTRINVAGSLVEDSFVDLTNPDSGLNKMIETSTSEDFESVEDESKPSKAEPEAPASTATSSQTTSAPADKKEEESGVASPSESKVLNFSSYLKLYESEFLNEAEVDGDSIDFSTQNVAIYKVNTVENADENSTIAPPKFKYFAIDASPETYNAQTNEPIDVASDEIDMEDTRKGFATVIPRHESEWLSIETEDIEPTEDALTFQEEPEEEKAQSYVFVGDDEVKLKIKDDMQKMKDTKAKGFNLLKELTTEEERERLGIDKWEELDVIKLKGDPLKDIEREIKLREKGSFGGVIPNGQKKTFTPKDGELYYLALSIFNRMKNRVKVK